VNGDASPIALPSALGKSCAGQASTQPSQEADGAGTRGSVGSGPPAKKAPHRSVVLRETQWRADASLRLRKRRRLLGSATKNTTVSRVRSRKLRRGFRMNKRVPAAGASCIRA
jgi:hypothetical protein